MTLSDHPVLKPLHINLAMFLTVAGMLGFGYYLQFVKDLEPCPLCMTQRFAFMAVGALAFIGLFNSNSAPYRRATSGLGAIAALIGLAVACRQIWLQNLPEDQVPACGPGFGYIVDTFPLLEAIEIMFKGNGNCAEVSWTFIGLSIPYWAALAFVGYAALNFFQLLRK